MYMKKSLVLIGLIGIIILTSHLLTSSNPLKKIRSGVVRIPSSTEMKTDVELAILDLIKRGEGRALVKLSEKERCYWIRPTHNGTHYLLQILEYRSVIGSCMGIVRNEREIVLDRGVNILGGSGCVCGGKMYLFEMGRSGLRIVEGGYELEGQV